MGEFYRLSSCSGSLSVREMTRGGFVRLVMRRKTNMLILAPMLGTKYPFQRLGSNDILLPNQCWQSNKSSGLWLTFKRVYSGKSYNDINKSKFRNLICPCSWYSARKIPRFYNCLQVACGFDITLRASQRHPFKLLRATGLDPMLFL